MKRINFSIFLTISLLFGVFAPRIVFAEDNDNQTWARNVMQGLGVAPLEEGDNLPDALIFVTFKGPEYNYRVTKIINNDKENSIIAQKIPLVVKNSENSDVLRAIQYLKPSFNIENSLPKYIKELKLISEKIPKKDDICFDPPVFKAYIRENGKVTFYNFNKSCPNKEIYEFRCHLDYDVPCKQVKREDVDILVSKRTVKIEKASQY